MKKISVLLISGLFILLGTTFAFATIIFENQGGVYPVSSGGYYYSHDETSINNHPAWRLYDDFTLNDVSDIQSVLFHARVLMADQFDFIITEATDGLPGNTIYQQSLNRADYIVDEYQILYQYPSGEAYYEVDLSFNLLSSLQLSPGDYFLSIYGINGSEIEFANTWSLGWSNAFAVQEHEGVFNITTGVETAFTLYDSQLPAATPEPATMLLFGIGLLCIAGVSRKKTLFYCNFRECRK